MNTNNFVPFQNDSSLPYPEQSNVDPRYQYPVGQPYPAQNYQPNPPMLNILPAPNYGVPIMNPLRKKKKNLSFYNE